MTATHADAYFDIRALRMQLAGMLLDDVVPFWMQHSIDREYGGFLTCLDRDGSVYSTDKSVWMQGRQIWMLATLYEHVRRDPAWLATARGGASFLESYCYDLDGRMFFSLTRSGHPLRKRRYVFSESFATIAYAALSRALAHEDAQQAEAAGTMAMQTFSTMLRCLRTPGILEPKIIPTTRRTQSLATPMILLATAQELRGLGRDVLVREVTDACLESIFDNFLRPEQQGLFEHASSDYRPLEGPMSRLLNPGHAIEAAWFIMREANVRKDTALFARACEILDWTLARGWDAEYGGFFAFQDSEGRPVERIEWDMKLWWPHTEAMIATLMAWQGTGKEEYRIWFSRIWDYARAVFSDPAHGEWFGYAHRDGTNAGTLKGSIWKGMFHVPRALWMCMRVCDEMTPPS